MRPRVVVIGSSNTDLVLPCSKLPGPGESVLGGELVRFAGGKGANQAVAAARAGARVCFVGARGDDDFGAAAADGLRREGIDIRYFQKLPGQSSGVALILLGGKQRENMIAVARSANDSLSPADILAAAPVLERAQVLVSQLEIPVETVLAAAQFAHRCQIPFVLNPAPARPLPAKLLKRVSVLVPNQHEVIALGGAADVARAAENMLAKGCGAVVVTLGKDGALVCTREGDVEVKAPRVKPVDTVGAGDCFTGWLAAGIAAGASLPEAAHRACAAAAIAVTRPGAQAGMPFAHEVGGESTTSASRGSRRRP